MKRASAKVGASKGARGASRTTRPRASLPARTVQARIKAEASRMAHRIAAVKFDPAQSNSLNRRYWEMADGGSPIYSLAPDVRRRLRERCRYEAHNNPWAKGILTTVANDLVGTGPRLRCLTADQKANQAVEQCFQRWASAAGLAPKLRTMRFARGSDGECFAVKNTNKALAHPVKLDIRLYEADQFETPDLFGYESPERVSGIEYDAAGNPVRYNMLDAHPGERSGSSTLLNNYRAVPASQVIHYFRAERPGQLRGVPDLTPALILFAAMRRYTAATVGAAEYQAARSGYIYTKNTPDAESADETGMMPFDTVEFNHNELTALPDGWEATFAPASQPVTTYGDFQYACIREACRAMNVPVSVAIGDSSKANYSSGRLDHQVYLKQIGIEQTEMVHGVIDPLFADWWSEAILVSELWGTGPGQMPLALRAMKSPPPRKWMFDGRGHVDPMKEAEAAGTRIRNRMSTLADECAKEGRDWMEVVLQQGAERALCEAQGVTYPGDEPPAPAPNAANAQPDPAVEESVS